MIQSDEDFNSSAWADGWKIQPVGSEWQQGNQLKSSAVVQVRDGGSLDPVVERR